MLELPALTLLPVFVLEVEEVRCGRGVAEMIDAMSGDVAPSPLSCRSSSSSPSSPPGSPGSGFLRLWLIVRDTLEELLPVDTRLEFELDPNLPPRKALGGAARVDGGIDPEA